MPISGPPGEVEPGTKELRLAVVCYGGVSLAIYMHGVTRELQSLFRASQAFARNPRENPFPADQKGTERAYWQALHEACEHDSGLATRIAVDIISGTSAGGINGIVLAKALSLGTSQDALRDIWLKQGSIAKLLNPFTGTTGGVLSRLKGAATAVSGARQGPLNGNFLLSQVYDALEAMDAASSNATPAKSGSGPSPWPIELHVTLTDLLGLPQGAPAWDPKVAKDRRHSYELVFRTRDPRTEANQFRQDDNRALAFAARATSSFPGAFPPTRISDLERLAGPWEGLAGFLEDHWALYELSGADATTTQFVDGGVLDNAPFGLAIKAIEERPATSAVERKLLYIQPDPKDPPEPEGQSAPGALKVIWAGLSAIPRREPILNDLLRVRLRNERVHRARDVVRAAEAGATEWLNEPPAIDQLHTLDADLHNSLGEQPAAANAYRQLKLHAVVERLGDVACQLLNFPRESDLAFFVKDVLTAWARTEGLFTPSAEQWTAVQLPFLQAFDLGYRERRIRFVIDAVNELYGSGDRMPPRDQLDKLKRALYERVWAISALAWAAREGAWAQQLQQVFGREIVLQYLTMDGDPAANVQAFLEEHTGQLDDLRQALEAFLTPTLEGFTSSTYQLLDEATRSWPANARVALLRRYVAFPAYDALLFPIHALSDLGELDPVEIIRLSPLDSRLLGVPGVEGRPVTVADKLQGDAAGHFAAFFARPKRENDYLWGRLDAVERLIGLVVGARPSRAYKMGFKAVLDSEVTALPKVRDLLDSLQCRVKELDDELSSESPIGAGPDGA